MQDNLRYIQLNGLDLVGVLIHEIAVILYFIYQIEADLNSLSLINLMCVP